MLLSPQVEVPGPCWGLPAAWVRNTEPAHPIQCVLDRLKDFLETQGWHSVAAERLQDMRCHSTADRWRRSSAIWTEAAANTPQGSSYHRGTRLVRDPRVPAAVVDMVFRTVVASPQLGFQNKSSQLQISPLAVEKASQGIYFGTARHPVQGHIQEKAVHRRSTDDLPACDHNIGLLSTVYRGDQEAYLDTG